MTFLDSLWFLYTRQEKLAVKFMKDCVDMSKTFPLDEQIWIIDVLKQYAEKIQDIELMNSSTEQLLNLYKENKICENVLFG